MTDSASKTKPVLPPPPVKPTDDPMKVLLGVSSELLENSKAASVKLLTRKPPPVEEVEDDLGVETSQEGGFFQPDEDELEEMNKDKSKRYLIAQSLGLMPLGHERKTLTAVRAKWSETIPLLDHPNREIRIGAMMALLENARQDSLVSKKDIKILIQRLEPKKTTNVVSQPQGKVVRKATEDSAAVKAVKEKYPDASQRTKDSEYAREIRLARKVKN